MDKFTPTIITSKKADQHLVDIRAKHADILQGIQNQALRVAEYNKNKDIERQQQSQLQSQQAQEDKKQQAEQMKESQKMQAEQAKAEKEYSIKQQEIALKREALKS